MSVNLLKYWNRIRSSFWFLPTVMAAGAVALSFAGAALDEPLTEWLSRTWGWTFTGGAEAASSVLAGIAGSMITLAGVVFSMTLVALSLASSQLGPRLLRNFMRDTTTQVVLGTFVSTFLYCLLVLRTIRRAEERLFVPHLSVTLGVIFAVLSVGVLIYFIHHVSVSIQANEVVARVYAELIEGIDRLYPERAGGAPANQPPDSAFQETFDREARPVGSDDDGYVQFVDAEALMELASAADTVIRLECRPGQYLVAGCPLVRAWPEDRVDDEFREDVKAAFVLGNQRTAEQDPEFPVHQLVEVAVRALSPGINDPFTAIACIDRLGSALSRLASRELPARYRRDDEERIRIIAATDTFTDITDAAFNQIRQYGRSSAAVTIRLLEVIAVVAGSAHRAEDRNALHRHAGMIARGARDGLPEAEDRRVVEERYEAAAKACGKTRAPAPGA